MRIISTGFLLAATVGLATASEERLPSGMTADEFFLQRIRPVLVDQCWRCHGPRKQRNGLRLDSRDSVLLGGHIADVNSGHPETSRLIDAIGYGDGDLQMPPDGKLGDEQIADFATWVRLGIPWVEPKACPDRIDGPAHIGSTADAGGPSSSTRPGGGASYHGQLSGCRKGGR